MKGTFLSNQGWLNLIVGWLDVAETILKRALKIKPMDGIIKGNLEVLEHLKRQGRGIFLDFLICRISRD